MCMYVCVHIYASVCIFLYVCMCVRVCMNMCTLLVNVCMFEYVSMYLQGRRKQFFSGQANQLQSCVYREFRVIRGHKRKLLCEAHSAYIAY